MSQLTKGVCRACGADRWKGVAHGKTCPNRETSERYAAERATLAKRTRVRRALRRPWSGFKGRMRRR